MSLSRIPLDRVFRSNSKAKPRELSSGSPTKGSTVPKPLPSPPYDGILQSIQSSSFNPFSIPVSPPSSSATTSLPSPPVSFARTFTRAPTFAMSQPQRAIMGTRTPQMLEYERQAEERAREQDRMDEERARMQDEMSAIDREAERIAQEEYEMEQYYQAEALKHAEEMRLHQEEVKKHQERVRAHERRMRDHEASSEAFAKVIAMPAKAGREKTISFMTPKRTNTNGATMNGGSPPTSFPGT